MKVLFTGASSFTGMWFVRELASSGHTITALFRGSLEDYQGIRKKRVESLLPFCRPIFNCTFGSDPFFRAIEQEDRIDLFCHHAAEVNNYKNHDFDIANALRQNTLRLQDLLSMLETKSCERILLTGSIFEQGEGTGTDQLRAVSPYGLSKGLTCEAFKYYCGIKDFQLGKFVIPNPFGPFEEKRYTHHLMESWLKGKVPELRYPEYIRDNIPSSLLAKSYVKFAESLQGSGFVKTNPSWKPQKNSDFFLQFAAEMETRLNIPCPINILRQTSYPEPRTRVNTNFLNCKDLQWDENKSWNEYAEYYKQIF